MYSKQKTMQRKKNIPGYANTRPHLNSSIYPPQAPSRSHLHITQIKERIKESRLPWSASTTARPLRARASRLSYTCTSRTRAPPVTLRVLHTHSCSLERFSLTASIYMSAFPHSLDLYERFSTQRPFARLLRTASRPLLSFATP